MDKLTNSSYSEGFELY